MDDRDLLRRALAAHFRAGGLEQPGEDSSVVTYEGLRYVVLRNVRGILAVYRVRNDDVLKGLKRWPKELDEF